MAQASGTSRAQALTTSPSPALETESPTASEFADQLRSGGSAVIGDIRVEMEDSPSLPADIGMNDSEPQPSTLSSQDDDMVATPPIQTALPDPQVHEPRRCYKCDRVGHDAWQCLSDSVVDHEACYECGLPDHFARQCPILYSPDTGIPYDSYRCSLHDAPRGYRNIQRRTDGSYRCKLDTECCPR